MNLVAPHITEEIAVLCGFGELNGSPGLPTMKKPCAETVEVAVQINGKLRPAPVLLDLISGKPRHFAGDEVFSASWATKLKS